MDQSPGDKNSHIAEELRQTAKQTEQLAVDHVRIARKLHRQGVESDEQLAKAEDIAVRATELAVTVQMLAEAAIEREARHEV